ncbi:MAG: primosomal protein N' [Bacilli bacterium]|nr:primosomal protein N' [Bacilli bacterium]
MYIGVLVELSNKNIDKVFTYSVPEYLSNKIKLGIRVVVPFGRQTLEGFVISFVKDVDYETKDIIEVVDEDEILNEELLELGKIMQEKTLSTLISCYQVMLPKALKAKNGTVINKKYDIFYKLGIIPEKLNDKQRKIISMFDKCEFVLKSELDKVSSSSVKTLEKNGGLVKVKLEHYRHSNLEKIEEKKELTPDQNKVLNEFLESSDEVFLLHGVTGSGKTEVYMEMIDNVLKKGKTAIVLVPEISLTPQIISRFSKRFGEKIALLHSALSDGERYDEWRRIKRGEVDIVIGARSALFAPLKNLGLIVIDEEHSSSYKQDDSNPRYSAIDMAKERIKLNRGAKLVLGSATPTLDSYARSIKGLYHLLELPNRINKKELPEIKIIDMNQEIKYCKGHFSNQLLKSIEDKISKGEQVILLLNRRGYASFVTCKNCGYTVKCPNCDITLTYHKTSNNLRCHYCGYATKMDLICPKCHEKALSSLGVGTEKIEEELIKFIPGVRILRMDFDTTSRKGSHEKMIKDFENQKYDILLGTQIVAKGLDFENVTLVGIVNADTSLNIPNFRSSEETFSLLSQVSGRSGRSKKSGEVILQTYNPNHYAIECVKRHNYKDFFNKEMSIRRKLNYPPYYYITYVRVSSKNEDVCYKEALKIKKIFEKYLDNTIILGPTSTFRLSNTYRYGLTLKYKKQDNLIEILNKVIDVYKSNSLVTIDINFNPIIF